MYGLSGKQVKGHGEKKAVGLQRRLAERRGEYQQRKVAAKKFGKDSVAVKYKPLPKKPTFPWTEKSSASLPAKRGAEHQAKGARLTVEEISKHKLSQNDTRIRIQQSKDLGVSYTMHQEKDLLKFAQKQSKKNKSKRLNCVLGPSLLLILLLLFCSGIEQNPGPCDHLLVKLNSRLIRWQKNRKLGFCKSCDCAITDLGYHRLDPIVSEDPPGKSELVHIYSDSIDGRFRKDENYVFFKLAGSWGYREATDKEVTAMIDTLPHNQSHTFKFVRQVKQNEIDHIQEVASNVMRDVLNVETVADSSNSVVVGSGTTGDPPAESEDECESDTNVSEFYDFPEAQDDEPSAPPLALVQAQPLQQVAASAGGVSVTARTNTDRRPTITQRVFSRIAFWRHASANELAVLASIIWFGSSMGVDLLVEGFNPIVFSILSILSFIVPFYVYQGRSKEQLMVEEEKLVLDGYSTSIMDAHGVARNLSGMCQWAISVFLTLRVAHISQSKGIIKYQGEKRPVIFRNVEETKQDMVYRKIVFHGLPRFGGKFIFLIFCGLLVALGVGVTWVPWQWQRSYSHRDLGFVPEGVRIGECHLAVSPAHVEMAPNVWFRPIREKLSLYRDTIRVCELIVPDGEYKGCPNTFMFDTWPDSTLWRWMLGPSIAVADRYIKCYLKDEICFNDDRYQAHYYTNVYHPVFHMSFVIVMAVTLIISVFACRTNFEVHWLPHLVTCVLSETSPQSDEETVRDALRSRVLRCATLPIEDRIYLTAVQGSELVAFEAFKNIHRNFCVRRIVHPTLVLQPESFDS